MAVIAFFGLGTMGLPMCKNLLRAGHTLRVSPHKKQDAAQELQTLGAVVTPSREKAAQGADFIISIVPADAEVKEIFLDPGMVASIRPGAVIVEMTSCAPETIRDVAGCYAAQGVSVLDAPVTGGLPGAVNGELVILGGGSNADFEKAAPVLEPLAKTIYRLGPVGSGKWVKAMTNLMGAVNLAMVGEFHRCARAAGMDMPLLVDVVAKSAGGSTQFARNFMKMANNDTTPAFALSLLRKDMEIALKASEGVYMPMAECAHRLFVRAGAMQLDDKDCSAICQVDRDES